MSYLLLVRGIMKREDIYEGVLVGGVDFDGRHSCECISMFLQKEAGTSKLAERATKKT